MTTSNQYQPQVPWDQSSFEKLKASWSPERIAADEKILAEVFRQATASPLLMAEIAWARQHGVKFFIDHQLSNTTAGYYWPSTGVMAISAHTVRSKIGVLAHELRHAWQDYQGLIAWDDHAPEKGEFSKFMINDALIEADAYAYGRRAEDEAEAAKLKKQHKKVPSSLRKSLANENADLREKFLFWFNTGARNYYGDFFSKKYGLKWGIFKGEMPKRNYEHQPIEPNLEGLNIYDIQDVLRLGVNFSGTKNYFAGMQRDILPKEILRPSLANTFWGAANATQKKLTSGLRKAHLKKKLAPENRKPRHPWP